MKRKKHFVLVFLATSLIWVLFDILFLIYRYPPSIDLNFISINDQNQNYFGDSFFTKDTRSENDNVDINLLDLEYYPDIVVNFLGDNGRKSSLPRALRYLSNDAIKKHSFDSALSDRISLNRNLGDVKGDLCRIKASERYMKTLPKATVIICFHNEAISALFRTVHSVINQTPKDILSDIILIDDATLFDNDEEGRQIIEYINKINKKLRQEKIYYFKNNNREGLVRSRLTGARNALGDVLVFLDSHCEVTKGWIEPLLNRIKENRSNVVCPVIEVIDPVDFSYKRSKLEDITQVGSFSWDLYFDWKEISSDERKMRSDPTEPLRSPTMAGGLFAIDRSYFFELGSYDNQMDIWGGENLEMSFRIWMCHGNLEIIPCSRVGHIFRKSDSPYTFPNGVSETLAKNFKRVAEVWMDEYKELYYRRIPESKRTIDVGDLTERKKLRETLKCHSFKWFMENIAKGIMGADPKPPAHGEVRNIESGLCLDSIGQKESPSPLKVFPCHGQKGNQLFVLTKQGEIAFNDEMCLDYSNENKEKFVQLWRCHGMGGNQEWSYDVYLGVIKHIVSKKCLAIRNHGNVSVDKCNSIDHAQKWKFQFSNKTLW